MIELIEERGWRILNGNKEGDEKGQWTFERVMGSSVIDYAITNASTWDKVRRMKIENRANLYHLPIIVKLEKAEAMERGGGRNGERNRRLVGRRYQKIQRKFGKNML